MPDEDPVTAAIREFEEELDSRRRANFRRFGMVSKYSRVGLRGNCNPTTLKSNTFTIEWPPHSGFMQEYSSGGSCGAFGRIGTSTGATLAGNGCLRVSSTASTKLYD